MLLSISHRLYCMVTGARTAAQKQENAYWITLFLLMNQRADIWRNPCFYSFGTAVGSTSVSVHLTRSRSSHVLDSQWVIPCQLPSRSRSPQKQSHHLAHQSPAPPRSSGPAGLRWTAVQVVWGAHRWRPSWSEYNSKLQMWSAWQQSCRGHTQIPQLYDTHNSSLKLHITKLTATTHLTLILKPTVWSAGRG